MTVKNLFKQMIVVAIPLILSCNIFAPKEPDPDKYYMTGEAWVIEGKKKMWDKDWDGAYSDFSRAIKLSDSTLSEAFFYRGKCWLRMFDVDLTQVWGEVKPKDERNVPFLYSIADTNTYKRFTDKLKGGSFDLSLVYAIKDQGNYVFVPQDSSITADTLIDSVFLQRKRIYDAISDTAAGSLKDLEYIHHNFGKMDGVITRSQYESDFLIEIMIKTVLGILDVNKNGKLDWEPATKGDLNERNSFRILCSDITSLDDMEFDSLKTISKDPRKIRENLDSILTVLSKADTSFNNFHDELINGQQQNNNLDTGMVTDIGQMINDFNKILPFFYYDDFKDNDDDFYNTNKDQDTTRMIWIDWNYNEKIDITATPGGPCIGDTNHMFPNGIDRTNTVYMDGCDTSLYHIVDTLDTSYRRYKYKGGYTYEFIAGDWGVDEEILDGEDNDQDGLVDEDTRITADTLDDDGDWFDTYKTMSSYDSQSVIFEYFQKFGATYHPMVWDSNTTDLFINMVGTPVKVPIDPEYISFHNMPGVAVDYPLYKRSTPIWQQGEKITHYVYWPKTNTINSYQVTSHTNQTDFIRGDYGMDEEWYDGLDNDRDGLIDEDVGERYPPKSLRQAIIDSLARYELTK